MFTEEQKYSFTEIVDALCRVNDRGELIAEAALFPKLKAELNRPAWVPRHGQVVWSDEYYCRYDAIHDLNLECRPLSPEELGLDGKFEMISGLTRFEAGYNEAICMVNKALGWEKD